MRLLNHMIRSAVIASVCAPYAGSVTFAQQPQPRPNQGEDVVRVNTELVQTDVMVFGKDGAFVEGLKREQFELKIDGKPREISFFERVAAGSRNEEAQLAAARGGTNSTVATGSAPVPLDRGRAVFFYLDDIHLSTSSMSQARALLTRFIDSEMGQNDQAAIISASGQVGFLQQLTNNTTVLRAAVERLKPRPYSVRDTDRPPMSEYQALLVDRNDRDVLAYFIDSLVRDGVPPDVADKMVHARASQLIQQAAHATTASLAGLDSLVHTSAQLPGRKLVFFISDGFFLDHENSDASQRLRDITSAAARAGVVIYSIDARGLVATTADASAAADFDPTGRLQRATNGETVASQDGLNAVARDTGGRPLFNTNDLSQGVTTALKETSVYYLLAWRPENEEQRSNKFKRVEVNIVERPELLVRLRRNFAERGTNEAPARAKNNEVPTAPKTVTDELRAAMRSVYTKNALPTFLAANFLYIPNQGVVLALTMKVEVQAEMFSLLDGKQSANFDVGGLVLDDQGKSAGGFQEHLTIRATSETVQLKLTDSLSYNYRVTLKPGLYQVRVAARDQKSERTGTAMQWVEMPDLAKRRLTLSSIIAGELTDVAENSNGSGTPPANKDSDVLGGATLSVDHRFARTSRLRFLVFTYNAAGGDATGAAVAPATLAKTAAPDVAVQIQVFRDNEPVITSTLRKLETDGIADLTRLPYAAEIPLQDLPVGRYLLKVTVIDRIAKTSASQQLDFQVD